MWEFTLETLLLMGYCFYMAIDLGSPLHRGHYNVVQWLFPLLLMPVTFHVKFLWIYALMLIAFILNIHYKPFLPMQHVLAEYLWLGTFLLYAFVYGGSKKEANTCLVKPSL